MDRWIRVITSCSALGIVLLTAAAVPPGVRGGPLPAVSLEVPVAPFAGEFDTMAARASSGGTRITRLEDLIGLPCGSGAEAGTVSIAVNPLSQAVALSCPRIGQFQLDVAVGGPGVVSTLPPDIDCGSGLGACSHGYASDQVVTLHAAHEPDVAAFLGWSGACTGSVETCQVTMDAARQVTAQFVPTLTVIVDTIASSRTFSCFGPICVYSDHFTDSRGRVRVVDIDTASTVGVCEADTTPVVPSSQFAPPSFHQTTCRFPVMPGHHLRLEAEGSSVLGGLLNFASWFNGECDGSTDPICTPAAAVTVHEEVLATFR